MTESEKVTKQNNSPDRLLRGVLTKIGDTFDRFTGRRWKPSSSLAASELTERLKSLLDVEAKNVPGKGLVVPHNIQLKMQWDKFSTDSENAIKILENELLTAAVDHINDKLYYTYAPLSLVVKPDYFTEGVKLMVGFEKFDDEEREVIMNVTLPSINIGATVPELKQAESDVEYLARFTINNVSREDTLVAQVNGRISVGRTAENSLVIEDPSVSKFHASLMVGSDGKLSVADIGSTNGTFVNDERIAYGTQFRLDPGDKVRFGTVEVKFECTALPLPIEENVETRMPSQEKIEIGGFEFSSKVSSERPEQVNGVSEKQSSDPILSDPDQKSGPES